MLATRGTRRAFAAARRTGVALVLGLGAAQSLAQVYGPTLNPPPSARPSGEGFMTMDDYPPSSLKNGEEGTAVVAYDIDEDGRVSHCVISQSTGYAALDEASCALVLRRAHYSPAKDDAGRPIKSHKDGFRVTWRLPAH